MKSKRICAAVCLGLLLPMCPKGNAAAKTKTPSALRWYLATMNEKPISYFSEAFMVNKKTKVLVTAQDWFNAAHEQATSHIETLSIDDIALKPVSLELKYAKVNKSAEFRLIGSLRKNGAYDDFHLEIFRSLPTLEWNQKTYPLPMKAIFFSSIPRFIARHESGMYSIPVISEEVRGLDFSVKRANIRRTYEKKKVAGLNCEISYVELNGTMTIYSVAGNGTLCELRVPDSKILVALKNEAEVKSLFPSPIPENEK